MQLVCIFVFAYAKIRFSYDEAHTFYGELTNLCCVRSFQSPRREDPNEHPQHRFIWRNKQNRPLYEPRYEKTGFLHMRKQRGRSASTAKLISAFIFATQIVQSIYYPNQKFQASSHLLRLYSLVCVRPGQKPQRQVSHFNKAHICTFSVTYKI